MFFAKGPAVDRQCRQSLLCAHERICCVLNASARCQNAPFSFQEEEPAVILSSQPSILASSKNSAFGGRISEAALLRPLSHCLFHFVICLNVLQLRLQ